MPNKIYTGIGSRQTPFDILKVMKQLSAYLQGKGYTLRSGGASGADSAFESGITDNTMKEIYLPWKGFENNKSSLYEISPGAFILAEHYHPAWEHLSPAAKKFHARNVYQVLGLDLQTPTDFVICWTKDGDLKGGTAQALRIALDKKIPIFNLGKIETLSHVITCVRDAKDLI